jgi:hypothetical protein
MKKLTLISIVYKGIRYSRFINILYKNGKATINEKDLFKNFKSMHIPYNSTYSIG